jgi:hypothetical protein
MKFMESSDRVAGKAIVRLRRIAGKRALKKSPHHFVSF